MVAVTAGMSHAWSFPIDRSICPVIGSCRIATLLLAQDNSTSGGKARLRSNVFLKTPSPFKGLFCFSPSSLLFVNIHPSAAHHLRTPSQSSPKTYNQHVYWTSLILGFFESCLIDPLIFSSSLAQTLLAPLLPCLH